MDKIIKKAMKGLFRALGYDIRRWPEAEDKNLDLDLYYKFFPKASIINKRFYNIGGGRFRHPFWINIDLKCDWYEEALKDSDYINYDLLSLKKMPIADETAEIVYSSHTIEHITDEAAQNMFNESYRILKTALHEIDLRAIDYSDFKIDYSDLSTSINLCNLLFNLCNQGLHEFCEALLKKRRSVQDNCS